jgi:hypothetical protein
VHHGRPADVALAVAAPPVPHRQGRVRAPRRGARHAARLASLASPRAVSPRVSSRAVASRARALDRVCAAVRGWLHGGRHHRSPAD